MYFIRYSILIYCVVLSHTMLFAFKKDTLKTIKPAKVKVNKVLELLDEPKKEKLSPEDRWTLDALEKQLAWIKSSVIPIPNKKG